MSAREKWLLLFILGIGPLLLVVATFGLSFKRAETLRFCSDCHTMTPWIADLEDPHSESLAAKHYRNRWILHDQCYNCHVNYAFLGPVEAKIGGLRHIIAYYTRYGMRSPIKLYESFPNGNCLRCHENSAMWRNNPTHRAIIAQLRSDKLKCISCHGPIHTPKGLKG